MKCYCGKQFDPIKWNQKYCSNRCTQRSEPRRLAEQRGKRKTRRAVRGRECRWCRRSDAETRWSLTRSVCSACYRQMLRRPCRLCGGPSWPSKGGCLTCDDLNAYERMVAEKHAAKTKLRVCRWCGHNDQERGFASMRECGPCKERRKAWPCPTCRGPRSYFRSLDRAVCARCDGEEYLEITRSASMAVLKRRPRLCKWCGRTDKEAKFPVDRCGCCISCDARRYAHPCRLCGGPTHAKSRKWAERGIRVCPRCD